VKHKPGPSPAILAYMARVAARRAGIEIAEDPPPVVEMKRAEPAEDATINKCQQCGKRDRFCWDINGSLKCGKCSREYFDELDRKARSSQ
jgi:hypothetical protein